MFVLLPRIRKGRFEPTMPLRSAKRWRVFGTTSFCSIYPAATLPPKGQLWWVGGGALPWSWWQAARKTKRSGGNWESQGGTEQCSGCLQEGVCRRVFQSNSGAGLCSWRMRRAKGWVCSWWVTPRWGSRTIMEAASWPPAQPTRGYRRRVPSRGGCCLLRCCVEHPHRGIGFAMEAAGLRWPGATIGTSPVACQPILKGGLRLVDTSKERAAYFRHAHHPRTRRHRWVLVDSN